MPYYKRFPTQCPSLSKWAARNKVEMSKLDMRKLNDKELACVLVYTLRKARKDE